MVEARLQSAVSRPLHILLVEDHVDGRETLRRLLELVGHYVDVAPNGIEGGWLSSISACRDWTATV